MPRYFAFLRAINVGGHTVKMERLKELFEELGLEQVETFIASGNVVFEAKAAQGLEDRIEAHLEKGLGYEVKTFLRTLSELEAIASHRSPGQGETLYVGFLRQTTGNEPPQTEDDELWVQGQELYWLARKGMGQSKLTGARVEKALGQPTTLRNLNTVQRLVKKYG